MALSQSVIDELAAYLDRAELEVSPVLPIHADHPEMDWGDAYSVQYASRRQKEARGCRIVGLKMGATSKSKWDQMGISEPCYGFLTSYGQVPDGGEVSTSSLIHPRVEPEIAFIMKDDLEGPDCTIEQVLAATDVVMPALEVIDSRYQQFKFDMKSVVADNTSAARFTVGAARRSPDGLDLREIRIDLLKNGELQASVTGAEVLGHPANSIATLVRLLAERGDRLPAGTLILSGSASAAVAAQSGDTFEIRCEGLGTASIRFVP